MPLALVAVSKILLKVEDPVMDLSFRQRRPANLYSIWLPFSIRTKSVAKQKTKFESSPHRRFASLDP